MTEQPQSLRTPKVMLGQWPKFFETGLPDDNGKSYYEADLLVSPEMQQTQEYANLKAAAAACAKEKWGDAVKEMTLRSPFRPAHDKKRQKDGSSYYPKEDFPGWVMIHVKTLKQPGIVGTKPGPDGRPLPITDEAEIYGGCKVRCTVNPNAYSVKGNSGVSFWLNNVQKLEDGEPISGGGGRRAQDDFEAVGDVSSADVDEMFS
jgi:hypothetical protein